MSNIQVFVQDFLNKANKGEAEMPSSLVEDFKEIIEKAYKFNKRGGTPRSAPINDDDEYYWG